MEAEFTLNSTGYTHVAIMGDIIGSERARSRRTLFDAFNDVIATANHSQRGALASPLTITLGDEFQGLCFTLKEGVGLMRTLRRALAAHSIECRFVIGPVRMDTPINTATAWNMMGFGLAATREKLADKRNANAYRFALPDQPVLEMILDTIGRELTDIERGWTQRQREIVTGLYERGVAELAASLKLSEATVYKIRRAGRFESYERQWRALSVGAQQLDLAYGLG